jgi:hypothetical protein
MDRHHPSSHPLGKFPSSSDVNVNSARIAKEHHHFTYLENDLQYGHLENYDWYRDMNAYFPLLRTIPYPIAYDSETTSADLAFRN